MKSHFLNLIKYDNWANELVLKSIQEKPIENQKIDLLFSHLLTAQKVWLNRCIDKIETFELWTVKSELEDLMKQNQVGWLEYLESLNDEDFVKMISHQNTKGQKFNTSLKDILTHLVNHGTYHR